MPDIAELERQLEICTSELERINLRNQLAWELKKKDTDHAFALATEAYKQATQLNYSKGVAYAQRARGACLMFQAKYDEALLNLSQAAQTFNALTDPFGEASVYNVMGVIYKRMGHYNRALEYYLLGLDYAEQAQDSLLISSILSNVAGIYSALGQNQQALDYYQKNLEIYRQAGDRDREALVWGNIASVYDALGDHEKALQASFDCLKLSQQVQNQWRICNTLCNIGAIYYHLKTYDEALEYFQQSLVLAREINNIQLQAHAMLALGTVYREKQIYDKGLDYLHQGLALAEQVQEKESIKTAYKAISEIYEETGDFQNALDYHKKFQEIDHETLTIKADENLRKMQTQFQVDLKEKETEILRQKNEELEHLNAELETMNENLVETQLKLVQSQARRIESEKLAKLGELASMMAHEINNALSGILGPAEQIQKTPPLDEERIWKCWETDQEGTQLSAYLHQWNSTWRRIQDAANLITTAGKRAQQAILDLQNFVGDKSHKLGAIVIKDVLQGSIRLQAQRLEKLRLIQDFEDDDLRITATTGELSQIFTNLISNATDALQNATDPTITIRVSTHNGGIEMQFSDNGIGIAPEDMRRIFEPMFTTKGEKSSGLGLSTVKRIVEAYNGTIHVQSELGSGTTFTLWLPLDGKKSPHAPAGAV
ncbi:MAG: GHKL domain-containing protein [Gemmatimonadetes bacterium]|nr:MAG: GHKL domain-containing protein [Gemmatimonadota bacterium]